MIHSYNGIASEKLGDRFERFSQPDITLEQNITLQGLRILMVDDNYSSHFGAKTLLQLDDPVFYS